LFDTSFVNRGLDVEHRISGQQLITLQGSHNHYPLTATNQETRMINDFSDRHYPLQGCFNFRDIGGYPVADGRTVRWGRYFRAGRQDRMTEQDLDAVRELGITTQVDLRRQFEISDQGRGPLESMGAAYHNIMVIPEEGSDELSRLVGDTGISGKRYLGYLEFGPDSWIRMFDIFAHANSQPILLHCTAGKDRTGVSTAFLLAVLGADRTLIEADYILTNRDVARYADFIEATTGYPAGMDRETMLRVAGVPDNAMSEFLDGLEERWGGPIGYLHSIGISDSLMEAVREEFLEG
jgi:protein-tyrosine phosphatase